MQKYMVTKTEKTVTVRNITTGKELNVPRTRCVETPRFLFVFAEDEKVVNDGLYNLIFRGRLLDDGYYVQDFVTEQSFI